MRHVLLILLLVPLLASTEEDAESLAFLELRDVALAPAMRLFSRETAINVVPSRKAAAVEVSLYLKDIDPYAAVEAMCRAHDLWYQRDPESNLIRIFTVDEYQHDLNTFRNEQTKVFTLLYPNALEVAHAIRDIYGERVVLSLGADEEERRDELERRLERFGLLNEFSQSIQRSGRGGDDNDDDETSARLPGNVRVLDLEEEEPDLDAATIQQLEQARQMGRAEDAAAAVRRATRPSIYVTLVQRHNLVIVRTGDEAIMNEIERLITQLDVPTPMVLLELQVFSVELGDGLSSVFDYQFGKGDGAGEFSTGDILNRAGQLGPGGTGISPGSLTAQVVGNEFAARIQALREENRVTTLATPVLLTANKEVSGLFIGDDRPIVTGFSEPTTIQGEAGTTTIPGSPETEVQEIGTTLLITPTINADRTVTLRLMQENSSVSATPANVLVPTTNGDVVQQEVDVVQRRTLSGTVVAKDQVRVAIGGLVEEHLELDQAKVPLLGDIPLLGRIFRRERTRKQRTELILLIRPHVLSTAADGERISKELLKRLSVHPDAEGGSGSLRTYGPDDPITPERLEKLKTTK